MKFLEVRKRDKLRAEAEVECVHHCVKGMNRHFENGNLDGALVYLENVKRSISELRDMTTEQNVEPPSSEWLKYKQLEASLQKLDELRGIRFTPRKRDEL